MKKATLGRDWVLQTNLEIINSGGDWTHYSEALCILVNLSEALEKSENNSDWGVSRLGKERDKAQCIIQCIISLNSLTQSLIWHQQKLQLVYVQLILLIFFPSVSFLFFYEYDSVKKKINLIHWNLPPVALQETVGGAMVQIHRCLENILSWELFPKPLFNTTPSFTDLIKT